jgi:hypothetical protein
MGLPEIFLNLFLSKVSKWGEKTYPSEEELFRNIVWPWYNPERHANGFEGFTLSFVNFVWEISSITFSMYYRKWRLFLRGLEHREAILSFDSPGR